jgi:hypothetical protein
VLVTIEGTTFTQSNADFVNGKLVYDHGQFHEDSFGMAIDFDIIKKSKMSLIAKAIKS